MGPDDAVESREAARAEEGRPDPLQHLPSITQDANAWATAGPAPTPRPKPVVMAPGIGWIVVEWVSEAATPLRAGPWPSGGIEGATGSVLGPWWIPTSHTARGEYDPWHPELTISALVAYYPRNLKPHPSPAPARHACWDDSVMRGLATRRAGAGTAGRLQADAVGADPLVAVHLVADVVDKILVVGRLEHERGVPVSIVLDHDLRGRIGRSVPRRLAGW